VRALKRTYGFLYQWYDTSTANVILNPGTPNCESVPHSKNCDFLSAVDNGWYVSGLIVVRQALPELAPLVKSLIAPVDFSIFYDSRATRAGSN